MAPPTLPGTGDYSGATFEQILFAVSGQGVDLHQHLDTASSGEHAWFKFAAAPGPQNHMHYRAWDKYYFGVDVNTSAFLNWASLVREMDKLTYPMFSAKTGLMDVQRLWDAKHVSNAYVTWLTESLASTNAWVKGLESDDSGFKGKAAYAIQVNLRRLAFTFDDIRGQIMEDRKPAVPQAMHDSAAALSIFGQRMASSWAEHDQFLLTQAHNASTAIFANIRDYIATQGLSVAYKGHTGPYTYVLDDLGSQAEREAHIKQRLRLYEGGATYSGMKPLPAGFPPISGDLTTAAFWDSVNAAMSTYLRTELQKLDAKARTQMALLSQAYTTTYQSLDDLKTNQPPTIGSPPPNIPGGGGDAPPPPGIVPPPTFTISKPPPGFDGDGGADGGAPPPPKIFTKLADDGPGSAGPPPNGSGPGGIDLSGLGDGFGGGGFGSGNTADVPGGSDIADGLDDLPGSGDGSFGSGGLPGVVGLGGGLPGLGFPGSRGSSDRKGAGDTADGSGSFTPPPFPELPPPGSLGSDAGSDAEGWAPDAHGSGLPPGSEPGVVPPGSTFGDIGFGPGASPGSSLSDLPDGVSPSDLPTMPGTSPPGVSGSGEVGGAGFGTGDSGTTGTGSAAFGQNAGDGWADWAGRASSDSSGTGANPAAVPGRDDNRTGMPFMPPMMGGMGGMGAQNGNNNQQERERQTWLSEDEEVWGTDGGAGIGVIGLPDSGVEDDEQVAPSHVHLRSTAARRTTAPRERTSEQRSAESGSTT